MPPAGLLGETCTSVSSEILLHRRVELAHGMLVICPSYYFKSNRRHKSNKHLPMRVQFSSATSIQCPTDAKSLSLLFIAQMVGLFFLEPFSCLKFSTIVHL